MGSIPDEKPKLPEELKDDNRDVSDLWKEALKKYKGIVGFDLARKFDNVQSMIDFGTKEMNNFHKFRHNEKKVDKLRSLFASNLDYIEKGAQQLISAAVPAFPPAAAIGTALTYLLSACRQVSADYDIVVVFFEDMNSFLQRIVILETRLPSHRAYQNCLMDVFTSFLTMCGFAHKYIELGRFKKWITNLMHGEDSDLGGARKTMDKSLVRLQNATEFAILGNTEEIKRMSAELKKNQQSHTAMMEEQKVIMTSIADTTENIRSDMAKLLKAFNDQKKDRGKDAKKASAPEQGKPASAKRIRNVLPDAEAGEQEYHILKETLVADTCTWMFSEAQWEEWLAKEDGTRPLLAFTGEPGTGKSHVGASVYDKLMQKAREDTTQRTCATHFYFREQQQTLSYFLYAISTVIVQVVEQSAPLCELINTEFIRDELSFDTCVWEDLVRHLLAPAFKKESKNHLYIVMDGIDELNWLAAFVEFIKMIKEQELRISVVSTSRPDILPQVEEAASIMKIEITKEKQLPDLKALIWSRINSLTSLRTFGRYVKQRIADKVEEAAPNMLYAEHMLQRFDTLGREGAVLRNLDRPLPANLTSIYEGLLEECLRRTPSKHHELVSKLLHWTAWSFRPLLLDEVVSLVKFYSDGKDFDLEEIPEPFAKFIRVGDPGADAEARAKAQSQNGYGTAVQNLEKSQDAFNPDNVYNDGVLPVKFKERSMRGFFQMGPGPEESSEESPEKTTETSDEKAAEASPEKAAEASPEKAASPETSPEASNNIRWKPSEAHRQIFLAVAKIARPPENDPMVLNDGLRTYAAQFLIAHWQDIDPHQHTPEENAEVMEALWAAFSNQNGFVVMLERTGPKYEEKFHDIFFWRVPQWAWVAETYREHLSEGVANWWAQFGDTPRKCMLELAKSHIRELCKCVYIDRPVTLYQHARKALEVGQLDSLLVEQAKKNFASALGDHPVDKPLSEKKGSLGIAHLFEDITMDAIAYKAIAAVLLNYKYKEPAEVMCRKALELCDGTVLQRVRILSLLGRIQLQRKHTDEARDTIDECLKYFDHEDIVPALKRVILVTRARIVAQYKDKDSAAAYFARARAADPTNLTPGDILEEEVNLFTEQGETQHYMHVLKNWSPLERLTWMAWKYPELAGVRHARLRDFAVETGEKEFVIKIYEDALRYLDNVNAGAPIRVDLAYVYFQVSQDLEQTRKTFNEVLDSSSTGWPYAVTDEIPEYILESAIGGLTDVLYRLFIQSNDPLVKRQLLEESEGLTSRPLALDVPQQSSTSLLERRITLARMYLKVGPVEKFQSIMQGVIDSCIEALQDKVGWNDSDNLINLAAALTILAEAVPKGEALARLARVIYSAKFSKLTAEDEGEGEEGDGDDEGDEDEEEDDEEGGDESEDGEKEAEPPTDEGDLDVKNTKLPCDGCCIPEEEFAWWGGRVGYECITCFDAFLCESCYQARQADNRGEQPLKGRQFCGRDHQYIKGPIEGWQGVKDGKVMIAGEEPVAFEELLRKIKDELCKEAWEQFWKG